MLAPRTFGGSISVHIFFFNLFLTNLSSQQSINIKKNFYKLKWERWRPFRVGVPFWVHKELSKSYREGTAQKLKSMAQPYKTKVLKKS